jgi:Zn-dependent protease/CBS domain-containing protein
MSWSITLFRVAGSEIRIHLTFLLLLAWFGVSGYQLAGWAGSIGSVLFIIAVFACVVLHELGHVLMARRFGITTPDITLLPIGGMARLSRIPEKPSEELAIAVAGPLVNVVIAGVLLLFGADLTLGPNDITGYGHGFISQLAVTNLYLFAFNLIPAFPMDGGRVLRALLALRLGRVRATRVAARIGQGIALIFAVLGLLWGNMLLVLVAGFVFLAAAGESGATSMMGMAARIPLSQAMIRVFETLSPQSSIGAAEDLMLRTPQREFPVVDGGGRMRGVVTQLGIARALKATGRGTPVLDVMEGAPLVPERTSLVVVVRLIFERGAPIVGVVDQDERLMGYVSRERISDLAAAGDTPETNAGAPGPWQRAGRT